MKTVNAGFFLHLLFYNIKLQRQTMLAECYIYCIFASY